ncbi:hypothetical protein SADUNF_Sadunf01G0087500 [Salix dunnii]|uniref:Uncharacterized protein n=1 Tax=Salix dunnii TaxID=1413687 RepID=A0A835NAS5_9ROSI|nr:hypothetical protein SADUNF_Sadunf01G0087500 [Salix dunnii]
MPRISLRESPESSSSDFEVFLIWVYLKQTTMASRDKKPTKPSCSRAGCVRTLSDLNRWSGPDCGSDDEDAPQEYYTGGEKR